MRIEQYVYFSVYSETATADEIASYLGLDPDRIRVRGSRSPDPPRPRHHAWELRCDSPGLRIGEQAARVLDRLRGVEDRLVTIGGDLLGRGGGCWLHLVRYFEDEEGDEDLPPNPLFGWHLDSDSVSFLGRVGAEIDCDEIPC